MYITVIMCVYIFNSSRSESAEGRLSVASIYGIYSVMAGYTLRQVFWC